MKNLQQTLRIRNLVPAATVLALALGLSGLSGCSDSETKNAEKATDKAPQETAEVVHEDSHKEKQGQK